MEEGFKILWVIISFWIPYYLWKVLLSVIFVCFTPVWFIVKIIVFSFNDYGSDWILMEYKKVWENIWE